MKWRVQEEAANGSAEPHKHSSSKHREPKHKHRDRDKGAAPQPAEPQGKPWLAQHILVKIIDKRLQDGRCISFAWSSPENSVDLIAWCVKQGVVTGI